MSEVFSSYKTLLITCSMDTLKQPMSNQLLTGCMTQLLPLFHPSDFSPRDQLTSTNNDIRTTTEESINGSDDGHWAEQQIRHQRWQHYQSMIIIVIIFHYHFSSFGSTAAQRIGTVRMAPMALQIIISGSCPSDPGRTMCSVSSDPCFCHRSSSTQPQIWGSRRNIWICEKIFKISTKYLTNRSTYPTKLLSFWIPLGWTNGHSGTILDVPRRERY